MPFGIERKHQEVRNLATSRIQNARERESIQESTKTEQLFML